MLPKPAGVPAGLLFDWALPVIHPPPPAQPPAPAARPQPRKPDVGAQVTTSPTVRCLESCVQCPLAQRVP